MADHAIEELLVSNLLLDVENPRHVVLANQREALKEMMDVQGEKLIKLAGDIVEAGTNPAGLPIVIPHKDEKTKYIVLEGNRRITALKLLSEPSLTDRSENRSLKKKFKEMSSTFRHNLIDRINCVVFEHREDAARWIRLMHTGENQGIGRVDWDAGSVARFSQGFGKSSRSLQAIEFVKRNADLNEETQNNIGSISITNLDRLLGDPAVLSVLGLRVEEGELRTNLPKDEVLKGLTKIIKDLTDKPDKRIHVKDIYYKNNREDYIETFKRSDIPSKKKVTEETWALNSAPSPISTAKPGGGKKSKPLSTKRSKLIPSDVVIRIDDKRINAIYRELKKLNVNDFPNAGAVMLRVFLEMTLDHYLDNNPIRGITSDSSLNKKLQNIAEQLQKNGVLTKQQLKPITASVSASTKDKGLFSIDTFHNYVHNRLFTPIPNELKLTWDRMEPFMQKIWK